MANAVAVIECVMGRTVMQILRDLGCYGCVAMLRPKGYCLWRTNDRLTHWQAGKITTGDAMTKSNFSRGEFLEVSAAAAGGSLAARNILLSPEPLHASLRPVAPSDTIHFGMIGVGMQGSGLLGTSITLA